MSRRHIALAVVIAAVWGVNFVVIHAGLQHLPPLLFSALILPFLLVIAAAAAWGISNVCTRVAQPPDGLALMVWASLVAPLPLLGLSFAFDGAHAIGAALRGIDVGGVAALAYIVGPSTLFGFAAWTGLLRRYPAATVAPFTLLVPVFGIAAP